MAAREVLFPRVLGEDLYTKQYCNREQTDSPGTQSRYL